MGAYFVYRPPDEDSKSPRPWVYDDEPIHIDILTVVIAIILFVIWIWLGLWLGIL